MIWGKMASIGLREMTRAALLAALGNAWLPQSTWLVPCGCNCRLPCGPQFHSQQFVALAAGPVLKGQAKAVATLQSNACQQL